MYAPLRMDTDDYLIELAWPELEEGGRTSWPGSESLIWISLVRQLLYSACLIAADDQSQLRMDKKLFSDFVIGGFFKTSRKIQ